MSLLELVADDAEMLGCSRMRFGRIREIARKGNSADRQRAVYQKALDAGADAKEAMLAVVDSLIEETVAGLEE
jgi:carboxylate-amine ligase